MSFLVFVCVTVLTVCYTTEVSAFRDGEVYRFTSVLDDRVLTVQNSELEVGSNITLEPWQDQSNQKWLAVEAVVAGDNYLLIPKRQSWDWNKFKSRGDGNLKDRHNDLPDLTLVLNEDAKSSSHAISQQYRDSKPYQQWRSVRIEGSSKHLIKNVASGLCLKNPGEVKKSTGFFKRVKQASQVLLHGAQVGQPKHKFAGAAMVHCNPAEVAQQWMLNLES